jgi:hypothetical protein
MPQNWRITKTLGANLRRGAVRPFAPATLRAISEKYGLPVEDFAVPEALGESHIERDERLEKEEQDGHSANA